MLENQYAAFISCFFSGLTGNVHGFNPFTPKSAKKILNFILQNCQKQIVPVKVLLNSFHLNGHTLEFYQHIQKLQPYLLTQGLTLGVNFRVNSRYLFFNVNIICTSH